jgi:hypothetical protein
LENPYLSAFVVVKRRAASKSIKMTIVNASNTETRMTVQSNAEAMHIKRHMSLGNLIVLEYEHICSAARRIAPGRTFALGP